MQWPKPHIVGKWYGTIGKLSLPFLVQKWPKQLWGAAVPQVIILLWSSVFVTVVAKKYRIAVPNNADILKVDLSRNALTVRQEQVGLKKGVSGKTETMSHL